LRVYGFRVSGSGFRVSGLRPAAGWSLTAAYPRAARFRDFGFRVSGFGFRVSGFGFQVSDFSISGSGFRVLGLGSRVSGLWVRVSGFVFLVSCFGFRAACFECKKEDDTAGGRLVLDCGVPEGREGLDGCCARTWLVPAWAWLNA